MTNLHTKISIDHGEFKKETSTATDKIVKIVDGRLEQIKKNAKELQKFYNDNLTNAKIRPMRKHFLKEYQKFRSMEQHATFAQEALINAKYLVDTKHQYSKMQTQQLPQAENQSQLQSNAIKAQKKQDASKISVSNNKPAQLQI